MIKLKLKIHLMEKMSFPLEIQDYSKQKKKVRKKKKVKKKKRERKKKKMRKMKKERKKKKLKMKGSKRR